MLDARILARWLSEVIEAELEKPDTEIDMELVNLCADWMAELLPIEEVPAEELDRRIAAIKGEHTHV